MKRVEAQKYRYHVQPREIITMEITPIGTTGLVTASQNGNKLQNKGTNAAPKFRFTASPTIGDIHYYQIEFSFAGAAANAKYEILLSGSKGGAYSDFTPVTPKTPIKDPIFRFTVKTAE